MRRRPGIERFNYHHCYNPAPVIIVVLPFLLPLRFPWKGVYVVKVS